MIEKLKERGFRITRQRLMLLDIILEEECASCKEIYYKASRIDPGIGTATVYRMINTLEEIGAMNRRNMYKISCDGQNGAADSCTIEFKDNSTLQLSAKKWNQIVETGLRACGYGINHGVRSISAKEFNFS